MIQKEIWLKVGREYITKGATQLAKELGTNKQNVYNIVIALRKNGVPIPRIKDPIANRKNIADVVNILMNEASHRKGKS